MRLRGLRLGGLLGVLAASLGGCDNPTTVTRVIVMHGGLEASIRSAGAAHVESHGRPFEGVAPDEIAARLKLPAAFPSGFRFTARTPGPRPERDGLRLVLHFNPAGPPDGQADCRRESEAQTLPPASEGFSVTASWCQGSRLFSTGFMEAPKTRADDPGGFAQAMLRLMIEITRKTDG